MPEPIEYQNQYVETAAAPPPPAPVAPVQPVAPVGPVAPAVGTRAVTTSTTAVPAGYRARQLVWVILAVVVLILALRFVFFLAGANNVGFAHAIYAIGAALDAPFRGIFNNSITPGDHPLQWADVLAIIVYTIAAWIVDRVIIIMSTPSPRRGVPPAY